MRYQTTPTTPQEHARRNALVYLAFKQDRPHLYTLMLAELEPAERARVEQTVSRLEAEQAESEAGHDQ